jgi:hypothetical protein
VAKWDGTAWSELGGQGELGGLNGLAAYSSIESVYSDTSGNIYAGGYSSDISEEYNFLLIAKWDGTSWSELGGKNGLAANGDISSVFSDASGNIYAGGEFTNSSGNRYVAKWDGTAWSELGGQNGLASNGSIFSVYSDASGNIYAGGEFKNSSGNRYVAKYNVITGTESAGGDVWEMKIFPNPARNEIHISQNNMAGEKNVFFTLVDLHGRNVLDQRYESLKPMNVSTLPEGLYIATLKGKEKAVSGKVMIKR